jgi:hypothetical protein
MSSVEGKWQPFEGVRKPLFARAVVVQGRSPIQCGGRTQRFGIVSLDLLALSGKALGRFDEFKAQVSEATKSVLAPDEIVLACTHTHSAPESAAITDLYRTGAFKKWGSYLSHQIGRALYAASHSLRPCRVFYGSVSAPGLGIHRRYKTTRGIMLSHPQPPDDIVLSRDGAVDDSINVVAFRDESDRLAAILVNATCHPVYEMCWPDVSPDYPGELCSILQHKHVGAVPIFLNGAAGNINPIGVSAGPAAAHFHAERLARAVDDALSQSRSIRTNELLVRRRSFCLPTRLPQGEDAGQLLPCEIVGVRLGEVALIFLPGEPFAETAIWLRESSPFKFTAVVGYSEETVGYIPTESAFSDGGYETAFGSWSFLASGSEAWLRKHSTELLNELALGCEGACFERGGAPAN